MRIAEVSTIGECGIATYTNYLSEALAGLGHEVKVFGEIRGTHGVMPSVPYEICYKREEPQTYLDLVRKLDEWRPDIVHIQYEWALHFTDGLILELARPDRIHFITWHNVVRDPKSIMYGGLADGHIAHNLNCINALVSGMRLNNVNGIQHGTRRNKVYPSDMAKAALNINPKRKVIAVYGFVSTRKGYHIILNSLPQIKQHCPEVFFLIIGGHQADGGKVTANYVDLFNVAEELYPEDVRITGFVNDADADLYLSASDFIVFPHMGGEEILSASGSVRRTIDHGKLTATANIGFYSDFPSSSVLKIPRTESALTIGRWFGRWLARSNDPTDKEVNTLRTNLKEQAINTYWDKIAREHAILFLDALSRRGKTLWRGLNKP